MKNQTHKKPLLKPFLKFLIIEIKQLRKYQGSVEVFQVQSLLNILDSFLKLGTLLQFRQDKPCSVFSIRNQREKLHNKLYTS